ncbi:hypothetical protein [Halanaeroarchaeum sulfurireducens]|uniref:Permease n=1 Tax=Halanaeroarchaeum sulfurireducens TaxID=1604004 RepID=A0A0F7PBK4_9EURY|nr:hypothetical protein [Halanaeroarchaeum sulfurireducens]AKH97540.1 hypothetical protein HLASF_1051 [Halanaeroarchaeum sulfurireducens]ALG81936.1 hypothetical protein HLASA_1040 [Halanaeroarchaeum sulfurireducens]
MSEASEGSETKHTRPTGRYAFVGTVVLYLAVLAVDTDGGRQALAESASILARIAPVLVLVTALIAVSKYALSPKTVATYVGAESGVTGYLVAILTGIASHGPVYVWYALLRDMRESGMRDGLIAVFLYNRAIKLPLLPLFVVYFDLAYAAVLIGYMAIASVLQGLIVDRVVPRPE